MEISILSSAKSHQFILLWQISRLLLLRKWIYNTQKFQFFPRKTDDYSVQLKGIKRPSSGVPVTAMHKQIYSYSIDMKLTLDRVDKLKQFVRARQSSTALIINGVILPNPSNTVLSHYTVEFRNRRAKLLSDLAGKRGRYFRVAVVKFSVKRN